MQLTAPINLALLEDLLEAKEVVKTKLRILSEHVLSICPVGKGDIVANREGLHYKVQSASVEDNGLVMLRAYRVYKEGSRRAGLMARSSTFFYLSEVEPVKLLADEHMEQAG